MGWHLCHLRCPIPSFNFGQLNSFRLVVGAPNGLHGSIGAQRPYRKTKPQLSPVEDFPIHQPEDLTKARAANSGKSWPPELVPPFPSASQWNLSYRYVLEIRPTFGPGSSSGQNLSRHKRDYGRFWVQIWFFNTNLHNILVGRKELPAELMSTNCKFWIPARGRSPR